MNQQIDKKPKRIALILLVAVLILALGGCSSKKNGGTAKSAEMGKDDPKKFQIVAGPEMKNVEKDILDFAKQNKIPVEMHYTDSMEMMKRLNAETPIYDGALISNSIWKYMLDSSYTVSDSKIVAINPVVFAIAKDKAAELGFVESQVYMKDILAAVEQGKLQFLMGSATQTNSGASTYLSFLNVLAGSPEILTVQDLQAQTLKDELQTLFSGIARTSGSEEYIEELFMGGEYDSMVGYESSIIGVNRQLAAQGKEPLYLIYPVDGVSISDVTFGYISKESEIKAGWFQQIQDFLLSETMQQRMAEQGHRTGYGGLMEKGQDSPFREDWGIDTQAYLSPVKYPSSAVIKEAFLLFQSELKKPSITVFCLDYSGSMYGDGEEQLGEAMRYILDYNSAARDFIQFGEQDKIFLIPFDSYPQGVHKGSGADTTGLINAVNSFSARGGTDMYLAGKEAVRAILAEPDLDDYILSIVMMTDGMSQGRLRDFAYEMDTAQRDIGVYSIGFGDAEFKQLEELAEQFNGKVFDGRSDLTEAFQAVRGYS